MAVIPAPQAGTPQTRAQLITYYASWLEKLPGTYQGNYRQYDNMTWADLYRTIANADQKADPKQLGDLVLGLETAQSLGKGVAAAEGKLGPFIKAAQAAIPEGISEVPGVSVLSGIDAIGAFFNTLGNVNTWIRVGKVVIGGTLLIVGLAKITGMEKGIVGKAVKAAPLL